MSVEAMAMVLHHSQAKGTDKLVLLGIANHVSDGGAWPSIDTLRKYANLNDRSAVQKVIRKLTASGELAVYRQDGGPRNMRDEVRPNRYEVLITCPIGCDRTAQHRVRDLPTTQAELWITGASAGTRGVPQDAGGASAGTRGGASAGTPEPYLEPTTNHLGSEGSPNARASELPLCSVCMLAYDQCVVRERISGHTYTPLESNARNQSSELITPVHDHEPEQRGAYLRPDEYPEADAS